jgi:hypothetical protein
MAVATIDTTPIEIRRDEKGRLRMFFDGRPVPGVFSVVIDQKGRDRSAVIVSIIGQAVRIVEHEASE